MKRLTWLLAACLLFFLCACGGNKINGTWSATVDGETMEYTFLEDGTGYLIADDVVGFTYTFEDDILSFKYTLDESELFYFNCEIDNNTMTWAYPDYPDEVITFYRSQD